MGKYLLEERIGAGGMGVVFLAHHLARSRRIAVKVLHPHLTTHPVVSRRFQDEALAASRVQHPGSISIIDFDAGAGGVPFIAMELVPGRPLGQLLAEEVLPIPRALEIFDQILSALDAVHASGVVHADVKSDNILVEQQLGRDAVTIIDFGLARLGGETADPGQVAGTPEYMAPEVIRGEPPTSASDVYGAGVILYELLTGATPFAGGPFREVMRRHLEAAVVPPSRRRPDRELPAALDQIVLRALAKAPEDRFASAQELQSALAAISLAREAGRRSRRAGAPRTHLASPDRVRIAPRAWRGLARGSDAGAGRGELRRAIASALARGDVPGIASGYAALAASLARDLQLAAAICELEEGLDVLAEGAAPADPETREAIDPLVASLAALYELAGEPRTARSVLASADGRDTLLDAAAAASC